jgi:hypothetical protein
LEPDRGAGHSWVAASTSSFALWRARRSPDTIAALNHYASVITSTPEKGGQEFRARFAEFIRLLAESGYDENHHKGEKTDLTRAYWAFMHASLETAVVEAAETIGEWGLRGGLFFFGVTGYRSRRENGSQVVHFTCVYLRNEKGVPSQPIAIITAYVLALGWEKRKRKTLICKSK